MPAGTSYEDAIHPDLVASVAARMPGECELDGLGQLFEVLGDRTRMRILLAVSESDMCVQDLAALLGMTKSAVSHQLANLKANRLVSCRREGRNVIYSCADEHVSQFMALGLEHASGSCHAPHAHHHENQSED